MPTQNHPDEPRPAPPGAGRSYAAVYPVLAAGDYVVWRADGRPAGRVSIDGGRASRLRWPEVTPASGAG